MSRFGWGERVIVVEKKIKKKLIAFVFKAI